MKHAEQKIFCICVDVYKIYESDSFDKTIQILSTLKNRKLRIKNITFEKYKDMLENPNFEQNRYSIISTDIYKIAYDSIRLKKWFCYFDRSFLENINHYDLMGSICKYNIDVFDNSFQ